MTKKMTKISPFSHFNAHSTRSVTYCHAVKMPRQSLTLYLAWEYGVAGANRMLRDFSKTYGPVAWFRTKRDAKKFETWARGRVSHMKGRLGLPDGDHGIFAI